MAELQFSAVLTSHFNQKLGFFKMVEVSLVENGIS